MSDSLVCPLSPCSQDLPGSSTAEESDGKRRRHRRHRKRKSKWPISEDPTPLSQLASAVIVNTPALSASSGDLEDDELFELEPEEVLELVNGGGDGWRERRGSRKSSLNLPSLEFVDFLFPPKKSILECPQCGLRRNACKCLANSFARNFGKPILNLFNRLIG